MYRPPIVRFLGLTFGDRYKIHEKSFLLFFGFVKHKLCFYHYCTFQSLSLEFAAYVIRSHYASRIMAGVSHTSSAAIELCPAFFTVGFCIYVAVRKLFAYFIVLYSFKYRSEFKLRLSYKLMTRI